MIMMDMQVQNLWRESLSTMGTENICSHLEVNNRMLFTTMGTSSSLDQMAQTNNPGLETKEARPMEDLQVLDHLLAKVLALEI